MTPSDFKGLPNWQATLIVVALIGAIGIMRIGLTLEVSYRVAEVTGVKPTAGRQWDRFVTIKMDGEQRILRTTDRLITANPGEWVCVETRTGFLRRGHRRTLALPFYCRKALAARGQGAYL